MNSFAAIDLTTANNMPSSICSIGIAIVRQGVVAERLYKLVQPLPNYYQPYHIQCNAIDTHTTAQAPSFLEVWAQLAPIIGGLPLVSHNSTFKESCLKAAFAEYEMPYPNFTFKCICCTSRRKYPDAMQNHSLSTLAKFFGVVLGSEQNALSNAEVIAQIALKIL